MSGEIKTINFDQPVLIPAGVRGAIVNGKFVAIPSHELPDTPFMRAGFEAECRAREWLECGFEISGGRYRLDIVEHAYFGYRLAWQHRDNIEQLKPTKES